MNARGVLLMLQALCCATSAVASDSDELAEVVVTARHVPEDAARLPLSVDVADGPAPGVGGVMGLDGLASRFPGLAFESMWGGSNAAPILRGLSQPSTAGDNVGVFVDDVYQAGRSAMDVELLDLDRIEVVRGPQNTQFGRSTFAGAIRYVPAAPTADPQYRLQADMGAASLAGLRGAWSRRIGDSAWLGRFAAAYRSSEGTWRSTEGETLGDTSRTALALTIESDPGIARDGLVSLRLRYDDGQFGHPPSAVLDEEDFNCGARGGGPGFWSYYCGRVPLTDRISISPGLPDSRARSGQAALHLDFPVGAATLRSLTSYYRANSRAYRDFDGSTDGLWSGVCTVDANCPPAIVGGQVTRHAWPNVVSRSDQFVDDWSQELRIGTDRTGALNWTLGATAWWSRMRAKGAFGADRGDLLANERLMTIVATDPLRIGQMSSLNRMLVDDSRRQQVLQNETVNRNRSLAALGMIDVPVTPWSRAHLELRAEKEVQRIERIYVNSLPVGDPDPAPVHFTEVTPRLSVDFAPGEHWYGYASIARGARSGGVNTVANLDPDEQTYDPEYNWTTELALRFAGDGLVQNAQATVYQVDWRHAQIMGLPTTPGNNSLIITNTAGITSRGIEAQLRLRAGRLLTGTLAWSLADARFQNGSDDPGSRVFCGLTAQPPTSDFCVYGPPRSTTGGSIKLVPYLDGNHAARAPRVSWNVGLQLRPIAVGAGWSAGAEGALSGQDDAFERPINGARYGARQLLSARITLQKGSMAIAFWGSNLTDERYVRTAATRGGNFYPSLPRPLDLLYGEGRRLGLSLSLDVIR